MRPGLVVALVLAGLAYREERRAEDALNAATQTANGLIFDLAQRFKEASGVPVTLIKDILDRALALQQQLAKSGPTTTALQFSQAAALDGASEALLAAGDSAGALSTGQQELQILQGLLATNASNIVWLRGESNAYNRIGGALNARGQNAQALVAYQTALTTSQKLSDAAPSDAARQHDLGLAYEAISNFLLGVGDDARALDNAQKAFAIHQKLAAAEPGNAGAQRDLVARRLDVWANLLATRKKR